MPTQKAEVKTKGKAAFTSDYEMAFGDGGWGTAVIKPPHEPVVEPTKV